MGKEYVDQEHWVKIQDINFGSPNPCMFTTK